ncbi:ABC transporter substrate-binding protein [Jiangella asiatica]|uniref:ABC transporter substrate-binding protein n=1 Tax=Jiangella asiatica TaxID=2530372 RepID=A0A4V6PFP2_9ACTN|nr:ABC transporter substrate-binding protein [Jiangella asiatica]TDE11208.1 ABC transporter substrate-binding protein [Jiangella asiatica]
MSTRLDALRRMPRTIMAGGAVAVLALAGCSPVDSAGGTGDDNQTEVGSSSGEPVRGGSLTIGRPADIVSLDGNVLGEVQLLYADAVYNTLVELDDELQPQPELAESWELADDATSITLTLRNGVTFHDGKELTSADVKYTVERVADPVVGAPQLAAFAKLVTGVETPDDRTVTIAFSRALPNIFDFLEMLYIVDQATVEGPDATTVANGTGPFALAEWQPERSYTLTRNEDYWDDELPYLDEVVVQVAPDPQTMVVQLESGELDAVSNVPLNEVARLEDGGWKVTVTDPAGSYYIAANVSDPALTDPRVRQAINHAIDRERFVEQTLSGIGDPTALPWPLTSPAYDEEIDASMAYDLDEARRLLDDAGVDSLSLDLWSNGGQAPLVDFAQILQADLASIGVELNVETPEVPRWRELSQQANYTGLLSGPYGSSNFSPASLFLLSRPFNPETNQSNYAGEAYTALVEELWSATDDAAREEIYGRLNELLLEESFVMPIATNNLVMASDATVHGWGERRPNGGFDLREVWVDEG